MKLIVTGLPRSRTSIIVSSIAEAFSLNRPVNKWGETHKYGENINHWLTQDQAIYKLWPVHTTEYIKTLENFDGNIIVSYTEDFSLFVAKLLRSQVTADWGLHIRDKEKISFKDHLAELEELRPVITGFANSLIELFSNQKILLKSAFVNKDQVAVHIQSSLDPVLAEHLRNITKRYTPENISDYIVEPLEEFNEYLYTTFGNRF